MTPKQAKNQKRAARARRALRAYMDAGPRVRIAGGTAEIAIVDLLTDIMHLVNRDKKISRSVLEMSASAMGHFQVEKDGTL